MSQPRPEGDTDAKLGSDWRRKLPWVGVLIGIWAVLPPYSGPSLDTAQRVEVADHVVPGVVMVATAAAAYVASLRAAGATWLLMAALLVTLSGVWMTATHVPLVAQALRQEAPWAATLYHTVPSVVVLGFGLVWAGSYWADVPR